MSIVYELASGYGQLLYSGSGDNTIRVWSTADGRCVGVWEGHTDWFCALALSTDGQWLYSGSEDHRIRVWSTADGCCVGVWEGHAKTVETLALSTDGQLLYSKGSVYIRIYKALNAAGIPPATTEEALLATCYWLKDNGFLWITPPDAEAPNGWIWTDHPERVTVFEQNQETKERRVLADDDPKRLEYLKHYNRQDKVMQRIHNQTAYQQHLAELAAKQDLQRLTHTLMPIHKQLTQQ
ncbi:hypothetical protein TI05_10245 [Achromatium sp. WMS3]|nr:hypothetical protein TI05_10245 [Achromatium sp. WMS3]